VSAAEEATTDESRGSSQEPLSMASVTSGPPAVDEKISVKERAKTLNRLASAVELSDEMVMMGGGSVPSAASRHHHHRSNRKGSASSSAVKRKNSRAASSSDSRRGSVNNVNGVDSRSDDSGSINTIDQNIKTWMVRSAQGDYIAMTKLLREDPRLAKARDFISGFTALHWAAKHGNSDMVKLLAGNCGADVNARSHGGYTPLHLACQFGHQDVFDLLVKAYGADPRIRDNAGKTPRQYMVASSQLQGGDMQVMAMSSDTFRQLKDRRRSRRQASEKNPGILRFGSLSVKVKKTTNAFNNWKNNSSEKKHSLDSNMNGFMSGGSGGASSASTTNVNTASLFDADRMPPPKFAPSKKTRKNSTAASMKRHSVDVGSMHKAPSTSSLSSSTTDVRKTSVKSDIVGGGGGRGHDSDEEYGFDSQWSK